VMIFSCSHLRVTTIPVARTLPGSARGEIKIGTRNLEVEQGVGCVWCLSKCSIGLRERALCELYFRQLVVAVMELKPLHRLRPRF
jgi:hypothetical protein